MERPCQSGLKFLDSLQAFLPRIDLAAEVGVGVVHEMAEDDHEVVQLHDRLARVAGDDAVFGSDGPIARRAGDNQIARLGIDENVLDPPQAGEILHRLVGDLAQGRVELDLLLQPRERDHPQGRICMHVALSVALLAVGAEIGQLAGAGFPHQGPQHAVGIHIDAGGEVGDRAVAAVVEPRLGLHRVLNQVHQAVEIGAVGIVRVGGVPGGEGLRGYGRGDDHRPRGRPS